MTLRLAPLGEQQEDVGKMGQGRFQGTGVTDEGSKDLG